ncbi:MAG TPA: hypothetical protein VKE95_19985 [Burkholderiales bacterium]|nr:hypothetical protein [Burkholderiales bacterium]
MLDERRGLNTLMRRLTGGDPKQRTDTMFVLVPVLIGFLAAATYWILQRHFAAHPAFLWLLLGCVGLQLYYLIVFLLRRYSFRNYFNVSLVFLLLVFLLPGLGLYGFLEALNSRLAEPRIFYFVWGLALLVFVYDLAFRWRVRWKLAFPYHVRAGEISAKEGVNIFVPLGYNAPWERQFVRYMASGHLNWIFSVFAGLGVAAQGFSHGTSFVEWFYFLLFALSTILFASNLAKYLIFLHHLHRFERQIGHPLGIQGLGPN